MRHRESIGGERVLERVAEGLVGEPQEVAEVAPRAPIGSRRRWYAAVLAGSAVIGQVVGGLLISADLVGTGWRPIFLVNVPLGVALIAVATRVLPADEQRRSQRLDFGGVGALSAALALLVIPLVLGRDAGWPAWTWVSLAAVAPAVAAFIMLERRISGRGSASPGLLRAGAGLLGRRLRDRRPHPRACLRPRQATGRPARRAHPRRRLRRHRLQLARRQRQHRRAHRAARRRRPRLRRRLQRHSHPPHHHRNRTPRPDISGLFNTASRVGGAMGVAVFRTLYLAIAPNPAATPR